MILTVTPGNFMHFTLTSGQQIDFFAQGFGQTLVQDGVKNTSIKGTHVCDREQNFTALNCSPQPMTIQVSDVLSPV